MEPGSAAVPTGRKVIVPSCVVNSNKGGRRVGDPSGLIILAVDVTTSVIAALAILADMFAYGLATSSYYSSYSTSGAVFLGLGFIGYIEIWCRVPLNVVARTVLLVLKVQVLPVVSLIVVAVRCRCDPSGANRLLNCKATGAITQSQTAVYIGFQPTHCRNGNQLNAFG